MGTGNLTDRSTGQTILDTFFNDIHGALDGDFVGRNASGVATSAQNLGTVAIPWGTIRGSSLVLGGSSIDTTQITAQVNRITSGKVRTTSNQPAFITPNGAAASLIVAGATTNLVVDINGSAITVSTNITKSSLTLAPASANTATLNDAAAAAQEDTRTWGESSNRKTLTVNAMGANISALVGSFAAFKVAGSTTEYFIGFVQSTTEITKCSRGFFYDSALAPINRAKLTNGNTITLMSLAWVFITNDGTTVDVSYTVPKYQVTTPTGAATGDYWYDLTNSQWKRYDGAAFQIISRTLIGIAVIDSANCVAARCLPFYAAFKDTNNIDMEVSTTEIVRANSMSSEVNVAGVAIKFGQSLPTWNITTMLAAAADMYSSTEQASTQYYCYVKDTGDTVISDISPYMINGMQGRYHPHNPWRCVGIFFNNASSNVITANNYGRVGSGTGLYTTPGLVVLTKAATYQATHIEDVILASGAAFTITLPPALGATKQLVIRKTDSTFANIITIARAASDTIDGATSTTLNTQYETITLISDGISAWYVLNRTYPQTWTSFTMTVTSTGSSPAKGTIAYEYAFWKREGANIIIYYSYRQSVAGTAGTGTYLFAIPSGLTINNTIVRYFADDGNLHFGQMLGKAVTGVSTDYNAAWVQAYNSTQMMIDLDSGANTFGVGTGANFGVTDMRIGFIATIPITGWN